MYKLAVALQIRDVNGAFVDLFKPEHLLLKQKKETCNTEKFCLARLSWTTNKNLVKNDLKS